MVKTLAIVNAICLLTVGYYSYQFGGLQGKLEEKLICKQEYYSDKAIDKFIIISAEVVAGESSNGHNEIWGDNGKSYGRYQIQEATFYWLAKLANLEDLDWKDAHDQFKIWKWAYHNGYANHWTVYRKLFLKEKVRF